MLKKYIPFILFFVIGGVLGSVVTGLYFKSENSNKIFDSQFLQVVRAPSGYQIPYNSGSLNVPHFFSASIMGGNKSTKYIHVPTYNYMRGLMFDMFPLVPGRDEFVSCINDLGYILPEKNEKLDILWRKACSEKIPENLIFDAQKNDLLERYRLNIVYNAFKRENPSPCAKLLNIKIKDGDKIVDSQEFESYIFCTAASRRNYITLDGEYNRFEKAVKNKDCSDYTSDTVKPLCISYMNSVK